MNPHDDDKELGEGSTEIDPTVAEVIHNQLAKNESLHIAWKAKEAAEAAREAAEKAYELAKKTDQRLDYAEKERTGFYAEQRQNFGEFQKQANDQNFVVREQLKEISKMVLETFKQACITNGKVAKHDEDLYGVDGKGGMKESHTSLIDSRKYITIGASIIIALYGYLYGPGHLRDILGINTDKHETKQVENK